VRRSLLWRLLSRKARESPLTHWPDQRPSLPEIAEKSAPLRRICGVLAAQSGVDTPGIAHNCCAKATIEMIFSADYFKSTYCFILLNL
jgi:hypothetical protein